MSQAPNERGVFESWEAPAPHGGRRDQTSAPQGIVPSVARRCGQAALVFVVLLVCVETALGRGRTPVLGAIFEHSALVFIQRLEQLDRRGHLQREYGISGSDLDELRDYLRDNRRLPQPSPLPPAVGSLGIPLIARQDHVSMRTEPNLGRPSRLEEDPDEGPWLRTEANQFVNIKKTVYFRGNNSTTNGLQMTGSFVAETATRVAIHFAAEACVGEHASNPEPPASCRDTNDTDRRMFVRALVDGVPVDPGDVVFAVGNTEGARSFLFTTTVAAGIHTVQMQWLVDPPGRGGGRVSGYMRNASLLVKQSRVQVIAGSLVGNLSVRTAPSGATQSREVGGWATMPHMVSLVRVPAGGGILTATVSAESFSTGDARMAVRALLDGQPMLPNDMIFAKGGKPQARSIQFVQEDVSPGVHLVAFQWLRDGDGAIHIADRSLALAAASGAEQPSYNVTAGNGVQDTTAGPSLQPVPGMTLPVVVPAKGNGEVAVQFSAEMVADAGAAVVVGLEVDNDFLADSLVRMAIGGTPAQTYSWVFDAKKLSAGPHTVRLYWASAHDFQGLSATMGDRSLSVVGEVAAIPDLMEQGRLGVGRDRRFDGNNMEISPDHVVGIEPVIGTRDVLLVLFDADRPGQPDQNSTGYSVGAIRQSMFTGSPSAREYFEVASGGRFSINEADTLGWFNAMEAENGNYWNHPNMCFNGYDNGAEQRASEAVMQAANANFPFGDYDRNRDGLLEGDELAIMVIYPQGSFSGRARQPVSAPDPGCNNQPLIVDGVQIESVVDCFGCDATRYMVVAHELGHQILGLDDLYTDAAGPAIQLRWKALMALRNETNTTMLNPAYRLYLGWVTPRIIESQGLYRLLDTKLNDRVLVLPRYGHAKPDEYFILENRQEDIPAGWDSQLGANNIDDSGIGVWHIVEDAADRLIPPIGVGPGVWTTSVGPPGLVDATAGRQGIRLLRPWNAISGDDLNAVYTVEDAFWSRADYTLESDECPLLFGQPGFLIPVENTLTWADCSASGYRVQFLSFPPNNPNAADPVSTAMWTRIGVP